MSPPGDDIQEPFMIRFRLTELIADKAFKERRVVSLTEVADATGIHRATLSKMANQPGANIGTEIIDKLCRYFACQPGELLTYVDEDAGLA
ncbi:helix-turn-helix domain-containing protein [Pseudoxanthomonas suwonensis]|uniref:helix-turn-helix domain-containing protein n=1 Tax=Pseudoxanthomonas suwonensis TaxID=314722 RepID=UPI001E32D32E|nr:helix-turn-helix transcriptional regulator [Pseudoxanthomonas suwonensis]